MEPNKDEKQDSSRRSTTNPTEDSLTGEPSSTSPSTLRDISSAAVNDLPPPNGRPTSTRSSPPAPPPTPTGSEKSFERPTTAGISIHTSYINTDPSINSVESVGFPVTFNPRNTDATTNTDRHDDTIYIRRDGHSEHTRSPRYTGGISTIGGRYGDNASVISDGRSDAGNLTFTYSSTPEETTTTYYYMPDNRSAAGPSQSENLSTRNPRSVTSSLYTLERQVKHYIHKRESATYQYYPGAERLEYDFIEERTDMYSTNLIESTAHLTKGSVGAGVLSMHEAYMNGGLWTSLFATFVIGILIYYATIMLVKSAQKMYGRLRITKLSYPDLAEAAAATCPWVKIRKYSKAFRYIIEICLFLELCGTCCIYQIMIAHTLKQVLEGINPKAVEWIGIRLYILISAPCLLLLVLIRSLKFLAPFAFLADIFVAMCVLATLHYSLRTIQVNILNRPGWKSFHGFIRFCGICMYCNSGICVALPVENNMRKPRSFQYALQYALLLVILLISITGFFGYWGWGEECRSPITVHMPFNTFTTILQFFLVMMLSTTFAVQFWVPFQIVWHYILKRYKRKLAKKQAAWERVYRIILACLVTAVSITFPNLSAFMIFLGQFALGFIALAFPAFIEILVDWEEDHHIKFRWWRVLKNFMLIVLGLFFSVSCFYSIKK